MNPTPLVKPTGFREYDARWLLGKEINLMGVQALGMGLGTLIHQLGVRPEIVTGHDFRGYSASVKMSLVSGLLAAGMQGARHRPRGVADGLFRPVRARRAVRRDGDGLAQRQRLDRREDGRQPSAHLRARRDDAAQGDRARTRDSTSKGGGSYAFVENFPERYIADLTKRPKLKRQLQGGVRLRQRHRRRVLRRACWKRSAARSCRSIASSTTPSRNTIPTPKT